MSRNLSRQKVFALILLGAILYFAKDMFIPAPLTVVESPHREQIQVIQPKTSNENKERLSLEKSDHGSPVDNFEAAQSDLSRAKSERDQIKNIEDMDRRLPQSASELADFAISRNPYENESREPHTVQETLYFREQALRIMALQSLETAVLAGQIDIEIIVRVVAQSENPAVKNIAEEILEFARRGQSFTKSWAEAVAALPIPE